MKVQTTPVKVKQQQEQMGIRSSAYGDFPFLQPYARLRLRDLALVASLRPDSFSTCNNTPPSWISQDVTGKKLQK